MQVISWVKFNLFFYSCVLFGLELVLEMKILVVSYFGILVGSSSLSI